MVLLPTVIFVEGTCDQRGDSLDTPAQLFPVGAIPSRSQSRLWEKTLNDIRNFPVWSRFLVIDEEPVYIWHDTVLRQCHGRPEPPLHFLKDVKASYSE